MFSNSGVLRAYFTHTGHTRKIAYRLHTISDTNLHRIVPLEPYPRHWHAIRERMELDAYHTILLGFPHWWNGLPPPVERFLPQHDFAGKTILPFSIYKVSPTKTSKIVKDLRGTSIVLEALEIPDTIVQQSTLLIREWIRNTPTLQTMRRRDIKLCTVVRNQIINNWEEH